MPSRRRTFLLGGSIAIAALSGCQAFSSGGQSQIGLTLRNYTDSAQPLILTLLREGTNGSDEPVVLDKEYTVPAPENDSNSAGTIRRTDVAPEEQYLVRVQLKNGRFERFHSHFYPAESTAERIDISIRRDEETQNLFIDFRSL